MRAAICHNFTQPLTVENVAIDSPVGPEVGVRVDYCAICHSDLMAIDGKWGGELPAIFGHEVVGKVEAVGREVTQLNIGDRVIVGLIRHCGACFQCQLGNYAFCEHDFALIRQSRVRLADGRPVVQGIKVGGFAEQVVVHQSQCVRIPDAVPGHVAGLFSCGVLTGIGTVSNVARPGIGASIVVVGAGGVGINCIQGAALAGANPVIAIDLVDTKLQLALLFGATETVNPEREDVPARVRALTSGRGADCVIVAAGSIRAMEAAPELVRDGGQIVIAGIPGREDRLSLAGRLFGGRGVSVLGSKMGSARPKADIPRIIDAYLAGRLRVNDLVSSVFALEDINSALDGVRDGSALKNVIAMQPAALPISGDGAP